MNVKKEKTFLFDLDTKEVSLVGEGANEQKFFLLKSKDGKVEMNAETIKKILEAKIENEADLNKILKEAKVSDDEIKVIKGAVKMLGSLENKVSPEVLKALTGLVGDADAVKKANQKEIDEAVAEAVKKAKEKVPVKKTDDGKLDLSKIPEDQRPALEKLWKSNEELVKKAKEADERAEKIEKQQKADKDAAEVKEQVEKAKEFKKLALNGEDFGKVLKDIKGLGGDNYDKVMAVLKSAEEQLEKSNVFKIHGSNRDSSGSDAWAKIEKAAMGLVEKSDGKVSKEEAVSKFLGTDAGRQLYNDYTNETA